MTTPADFPAAVASAQAAAGAPRVIGLDLSLTASGIASNLGWCDSVGRKEITTLPLTERLNAVDDLTAAILTLAGSPDLVVIEVPAFSRAGAGTLERSALWWSVVRTFAAREVPIAEVFTRTRMRYATGKGQANKNAIVDAVARRFPTFETGGDDNLCDAIVLAAMGADHLGAPLAVMPQAHRAALDAVAWPDLPWVSNVLAGDAA